MYNVPGTVYCYIDSLAVVPCLPFCLARRQRSIVNCQPMSRFQSPRCTQADVSRTMLIRIARSTIHDADVGPVSVSNACDLEAVESIAGAFDLGPEPGDDAHPTRHAYACGESPEQAIVGRASRRGPVLLTNEEGKTYDGNRFHSSMLSCPCTARATSSTRRLNAVTLRASAFASVSSAGLGSTSALLSGDACRRRNGFAIERAYAVWNALHICRAQSGAVRGSNAGTHEDDVGVAHDGVAERERDDDLELERRHVAVHRDVLHAEEQAEEALGELGLRDALLDHVQARVRQVVVLELVPVAHERPHKNGRVRG